MSKVHDPGSPVNRSDEPPVNEKQIRMIRARAYESGVDIHRNLDKIIRENFGKPIEELGAYAELDLALALVAEVAGQNGGEPEVTPRELFEQVKKSINDATDDPLERFESAVASFRFRARSLEASRLCNYNELINIAQHEKTIPAGFKIELRRQESPFVEKSD